MQRASAAFTFTLPRRAVVHLNLHSRHTPYGVSERRQFTYRNKHQSFKRARACTSLPHNANSDIHIRRASQSDITTASRVLASAFSEGFLTQEPTPVPLLSILIPLYEFLVRFEISSQLRERIKHEEHAILLAEMDDKVVGCAEVGVLDITRLTSGANEVKEWGRGGSEAYVGNVGVLPRYRGRGIGRRLVQSAQSAAEEWGLGGVWLCVEAQNVSAVRFYERLGFGCVAQEPEWFDEIGRRRRLFLCSCKGMQVGQWDKAKIVGGKLGVVQYLRYCLLDLRKRREANERRK